MDRLQPDIEGRGISHADIIIEAISENVNAKQQLFQMLEKKAKPGTILASNTSSIPLATIGEGMEAMQLFQEGVAPETIDKAAVEFGMPMGPIELADTIGLDVCLSVIQHMHGESAQGASYLKNLIHEGKLGRKNGKGFYIYVKGKAQKNNKTSSPEPIVADRLILRMLNESMACLREKVVADSDAVDAGMVFGTGFAPFRGGPMHYAEKRGHAAILSQLQQLHQQCGERFKPDAGWGS